MRRHSPQLERQLRIAARGNESKLVAQLARGGVERWTAASPRVTEPRPTGGGTHDFYVEVHGRPYRVSVEAIEAQDLRIPIPWESDAPKAAS